MQAAAELGVKVRDLQAHGREVPAALLGQFEKAEEELFGNVRAIFGGNVRQAVSGAAPIAQEILEFFYGCGVPVLEGYGMTETATVATYSTIENHRFGSVGARAARASRSRIADDGELLLKGANIFGGYHKQHRRQLRRDRRRLAAHRRPRLDRRGRLRLDHRPQEGHHHHRRRQEPHARQPRERPQAVPLGLAGGHARRPPALPGGARDARRGRDRALGARARHRGHVGAGAGRDERCAR